MIESPGNQRLYRLDLKRIEDLNTLRRRIGCHWRQEGRLPDTVEAAFASGRTGTPPDSLPYNCFGDVSYDPETAEPYGYRKIDGNAYELCAVFRLDARHADHGWRFPSVQWR